MSRVKSIITRQDTGPNSWAAALADALPADSAELWIEKNPRVIHTILQLRQVRAARTRLPYLPDRKKLEL